MDKAKIYIASLTGPVISPDFGPTGLREDSSSVLVEILEREFVDYIQTGTKPASDTGKYILEMATAARLQVEKTFEESIQRLRLLPENASAVLQAVASECLQDCARCNWGRVAVSLTYARLIATRLSPEADEEFLETFSVSAGRILVNFVQDWTQWQGQRGRVDLDSELNAQNSSYNWFDTTTLAGCLGHFVKVGAFLASSASNAIK